MGNQMSLTTAPTPLVGCYMTEQGTWEPGSGFLSRGVRWGRQLVKAERWFWSQIALAQTNVGSPGGLGASSNLLAIRTKVQTQVKDQPGKPPAAAWSALPLTVHWSCGVSNSP